MKKEEVLDFIFTEVKRLNDEEHVMKLAKTGEYSKLSQIECRCPKNVKKWFSREDRCLYCDIDDFPKGSSLAIALWLHKSKVTEDAIFTDWEKFADELAKEAGNLGKSIAYNMQYVELRALNDVDFFTEKDANKYKA